MPEQEQGQPLSLKYAAATNVLLGELKLDDNIKDLTGMKWKLLRKLFSKSFRKVNRQFQEWGMDTQLFWQCIKNQEALEKTAKIDFNYLEDLFDYYAGPTAHMTAVIFEHGATTIGQEGQGQTMYSLGYQFGRLVYMLDAFEDVEKDIFKQQFNPLVSFFEINKLLPKHQLEEVRQVVLAAQEAVTFQIYKLPFSKEIIEKYTVRLYSNISQRLYKERKVPKKTEEKLAILWNTTIRKLEQLILSTTTQARNVNYYLVSMVAFIIPLAAEYVGSNNHMAVYKGIAMFTGILVSIGLTRYVVAERKKAKSKREMRREKRQFRKGKRKMRRFLWRLKNVFTKKQICWEECCFCCIEACAQGLCDSCFQEACDPCCAETCDAVAEGKMWPWLILSLICIIIAMMFVFL